MIGLGSFDGGQVEWPKHSIIVKLPQAKQFWWIYSLDSATCSTQESQGRYTARMMSHAVLGVCKAVWLVLALVEATDAQSCTYAKKEYPHGSSVKMDEPCLTCSCVRGQLVCHLTMCPSLPDITRKGCRIDKLAEKCCPHIVCDSTNTTTSGFGKFIHTNQVGRKDDTDFILPIETRTNKGGCKVDESFFADGSALPSSFHCTNCYCLKGSVRCIKPKCHLNITGCQPLYNHQHACCPTHYDCNSLSINTSQKPTTESTIIRKGCFWNSHRYADGTRIPTNDPCRSCFCVRGTVKCTTQECAPPIDGCTPIRQKGFCCPLEYECDEEVELESTTPISSSKIRGNDRVIDFPYDQLGNDYQLVKRTPSGRETQPESRSNDRIKGVKGLMRPTAKLPSEFKYDESNRQEKSHSENKKPRSATSMHYFPPRGNNRRIHFSKRQRSSTTEETSTQDILDTETTLYESTKEITKSTVSPKMKNTYKPRRKSTIRVTTSPVTKPVSSGRQRKKTTVTNKDVTDQVDTKTTTTARSSKSTTKRDVSELTTPLAMKSDKFPQVLTHLPLSQETSTDTGSPEPHHEGYHVLDAGESYHDGFDDFHEESAFGIEWPALAANVYDYFKEESPANGEKEEIKEEIEEKSGVTEKESKVDITRNIPTTTTTTSTIKIQKLGEKLTTIPIKIEMQNLSDAATGAILKTTKGLPLTFSTSTTLTKTTTTTKAPPTTESSTETVTEARTSTVVEETTENQADDNKTTIHSLLLDTDDTVHDSSEDKTIFLRRVGLNFQVSQQKSSQSGINWTSRLVPEGHPAADASAPAPASASASASASARFSKTGTATIQKLPHYEGRGITRLLNGDEENLQTSRSEKEASTEDSAIDEIDIPISEDSPAFQVIPFLPEDAVFKEQQLSNVNKNWQSVTVEPKTTTDIPASKTTSETTAKTTVSSDYIHRTLKNEPIDIISIIHSDMSTKSQIASTESYLSRWVPIRLEDPLAHNQNKETNNIPITSSKSSIDFEEQAEESSPSLLGLLSLFGFSGLGGARKANTNNQSQIPVTSSSPQLATQESNRWLPLIAGSEDVKTIDSSSSTMKDHFIEQPLSTAALQMRLPNATGNMFLIGQPKEEILPIPVDPVDEQWTNKPTTTTEPLLELILSHIQNSSKVPDPESTVTTVSTTTEGVTTTTEVSTKEATTLRLRHASVATVEDITSLPEDKKLPEDNEELPTNNSNSNIDDFVNSTTRNAVSEETTTVSVWDLLNLFAQAKQYTTTQSPKVDLNNYSYFPLSNSYNFEPLEAHSEPNKSVEFKADSFNGEALGEEITSEDGQIDTPENEATGIYNPFILQVKGCDIYGKYYNMGEVVKELSSSCKQCVCSGFGVDCNKIC